MITTAKDIKLSGRLIYFTKTKADTVLKEGNLANDVTMGILNGTDGEGLLSVLEHHMHSCVYPPIKATKNWGHILKESSGTAMHGNFLGEYETL